MSDKEVLASQVQLVTTDGATADIPNLPSTVLRALFDEVTGSKEYHFSRLNKSYLIEREDVSQLCAKLGQWIEHLNPLTAGFRFVIVSKQDDSGAVSRENISSYQRFIEHDFSSTSPISCFEIYFNFVVPGKSEEDVSAYSMNIDLHGYCLMDDASNAMVGHEPGQPFSTSCAEVRIEYVDYLVSRNLELVVNDWFRALPEYKVPKKPRWAPDWGRSTRGLSSGLLGVNKFERFKMLLLASPLLVVLAGNGLFWNLEPDYHLNFMNSLYLVLGYLALNLLAHVMFVHIANNAWPRGFFPTLSLNIAGKRQIEKHQLILKSGRGFARELGFATLIGVSSSIIVSGMVWAAKFFIL